MLGWARLVHALQSLGVDGKQPDVMLRPPRPPAQVRACVRFALRLEAMCEERVAVAPAAHGCATLCSRLIVLAWSSIVRECSLR
jgi:hypothetical protein